MRRLFLLTALFITGVVASAQNPEDFTGSLLWKVSGNGLEKPSYIFGTYHLYGPELLDSVPQLRGAFDATEQVIGELVMKDMQSMQMVMSIMAVIPEEENYRNLLSEEEYTALDEGLKEFMGIGLMEFGKMKPGIINATIAQVMHLKLHPDFNPLGFVGIDQYLQQMAEAENKPCLGLETIEEQIDILFNSSPQKEQMLSLICTVENVDSGMDGLARLGELYLEGAIYELYDWSFNSFDDPCASFTLATKDTLLKNRNDKWIEQLPAIIKDKPSLIVVGALHLAAEEGILYQLHQLGYEVEKVE